jgi:hypothetical protein
MTPDAMMTPKEMESYKPDIELVILARQAGFIMPDFAIDSPTDAWAGRKVPAMWLALAKFKHICQQEEKAKFADAYAEFNKK